MAARASKSPAEGKLTLTLPKATMDVLADRAAAHGLSVEEYVVGRLNAAADTIRSVKHAARGKLGVVPRPKSGK